MKSRSGSRRRKRSGFTLRLEGRDEMFIHPQVRHGRRDLRAAGVCRRVYGSLRSPQKSEESARLVLFLIALREDWYWKKKALEEASAIGPPDSRATDDQVAEGGGPARELHRKSRRARRGPSSACRFSSDHHQFHPSITMSAVRKHRLASHFLSRQVANTHVGLTGGIQSRRKQGLRRQGLRLGHRAVHQGATGSALVPPLEP